jgi:hypothetical protein
VSADERERAWVCVRRLAEEPHDLSTPVLPSNLARELLATKADLIQAYEAKIQDLARETRRSSFLQSQLDREHQALAELWAIYETFKRDVQASPAPAEPPERQT